MKTKLIVLIVLIIAFAGCLNTGKAAYPAQVQTIETTDIHIVFDDKTAGLIKYTANFGSIQTMGNGFNSDIGIDTQENPHIVYLEQQQHSQIPQSNTLKYKSLRNGQWSEEIIFDQQAQTTIGHGPLYDPTLLLIGDTPYVFFVEYDASSNILEYINYYMAMPSSPSKPANCLGSTQWHCTKIYQYQNFPGQFYFGPLITAYKDTNANTFLVALSYDIMAQIPKILYFELDLSGNTIDSSEALVRPISNNLHDIDISINSITREPEIVYADVHNINQISFDSRTRSWNSPMTIKQIATTTYSTYPNDGPFIKQARIPNVASFLIFSYKDYGATNGFLEYSIPITGNCYIGTCQVIEQNNKATRFDVNDQSNSFSIVYTVPQANGETLKRADYTSSGFSYSTLQNIPFDVGKVSFSFH